MQRFESRLAVSCSDTPESGSLHIRSVIQFSFVSFVVLLINFVCRLHWSVVLPQCHYFFFSRGFLLLLSRDPGHVVIGHTWSLFFLVLPSTSDAVSMNSVGVPCEIVWAYVFFQQVKCCKFASNRCFEQVCYLQTYYLALRDWTRVFGRVSASFLPFQLHCHLAASGLLQIGYKYSS